MAVRAAARAAAPPFSRAMRPAAPSPWRRRRMEHELALRGGWYRRRRRHGNRRRRHGRSVGRLLGDACPLVGEFGLLLPAGRERLGLGGLGRRGVGPCLCRLACRAFACELVLRALELLVQPRRLDAAAVQDRGLRGVSGRHRLELVACRVLRLGRCVGERRATYAAGPPRAGRGEGPLAVGRWRRRRRSRSGCRAALLNLRLEVGQFGLERGREVLIEVLGCANAVGFADVKSLSDMAFVIRGANTAPQPESLQQARTHAPYAQEYSPRRA